jgi:hypothetical protein
MEEPFFVRPSVHYRDGFLRLVEDFKENGEKKYYDAYRKALDDFPASVKLVERPCRRAQSAGLI